MKNLSRLCKLIRYYILTSTTEAGSGHPTSSLSAVELMTTLFFGGFLRQNMENFKNLGNDRVIFSKGHAAPLLYSLYATAGIVTQKELMLLRKFGSSLQGHPTPDLPFVDVATGSLGQGLSVGLGMVLGIRLKIKRGELTMKREPTVWVLMGDSETAEGQVWEAMEIASKYELNNLIGIIDVNRLGQSGETELSWNIRSYENRIKSFGWDTIVIKNGHNLNEIQKAFEQANSLNTVKRQKPLMILAHTVKGKGISFLEDKEDWHGKVLSDEQLKTALKELGKVDLKLTGEIKKPEKQDKKLNSVLNKLIAIGGNDLRVPDTRASVTSTGGKKVVDRIYCNQELVATREAFGQALENLGKINDKIVVLDAEVGNSTYVNKFGKDYPDRFFQMYIDEGNMVSVALGLSKMGFIPYLSTFAAFLTRAFDQIRMSQYSVISPSDSEGQLKSVEISPNKKPISADLSRFQPISTINIVGSHCGVSIGQDGPSQMGLEDIAMMRSINHSTVLYPSDAVSTAILTEAMATNPGINYLRTTRGKTPVIYDEKEEFPIGGLKIHYPPARHPDKVLRIGGRVEGSLDCARDDKQNYKAIVIAAGITLHEALKAQKELAVKKINIIVVDLYSIKPLDIKTLQELAQKTNHIVVVEDHYEAGGIGEAVLSSLFLKSQLSMTNFQSKINTPNFKKTIDNCKLKIENFKFSHLCVRKTPCSGTPEELLRFEHISAESIIKKCQINPK